MGFIPFIHQHQEADGIRRREEEERRREDEERRRSSDSGSSSGNSGTPWWVTSHDDDDEEDDYRPSHHHSESSVPQKRDEKLDFLIGLYKFEGHEKVMDYFIHHYDDVFYAEYIYKYSKYLKENRGLSDFSELCNFIIATENKKYIYLFARDLSGEQGVDIDKLTGALIEKYQTRSFIYDFARNVKGVNIENMNSKIAANNEFDKSGSQNLDYAYEFVYKHACEDENADIPAATKAMIRIGRIELIYLFAKDVPKFDVNLFNQEMKGFKLYYNDSIDYVFKLAQEINGIDINVMAEIVARTGNIDYIKRFIDEIPGIDVEKMTDIVIKVGDMHQICDFVNNFENVDIQKVLNCIEEHTLLSDLSAGIRTINEKNDEIINKMIEVFIKSFNINPGGWESETRCKLFHALSIIETGKGSKLNTLIDFVINKVNNNKYYAKQAFYDAIALFHTQSIYRPEKFKMIFDAIEGDAENEDR